MAKFGAKYPCFCVSGEDEGVVLGKLVSANLTVNLASGELYADDVMAEQASEFASGSIAMETDDMTDAVAAEIYGATVSDGAVLYKSDDAAPTGGLAYYKVLMRGGVRSWQGYYYPRAKAAVGNDNAQTKGSSITFSTTSTTFTVMPDEDTGEWRETQSFDTEAAAIAWVNDKAKISPDSTRLTGIRIGSLALTPAFDPDTASYTAATTNASDVIEAWTESGEATLAIKKGTTAITNGAAFSWAAGTNAITFTVTNGGSTKTYTVTVTKS